jgi:hypothetical protein
MGGSRRVTSRAPGMFVYSFSSSILLTTSLGTIYNNNRMIERQGDKEMTGRQGQGKGVEEMMMTGARDADASRAPGMLFFPCFYIYSINDFLQVD